METKEQKSDTLERKSNCMRCGNGPIHGGLVNVIIPLAAVL